MVYLLDANVLIDANRDYYPLDRVPEFWAWLRRMGNAGKIKIPVEVWEEVSEGTDQLASWMRLEETKDALQLQEEIAVEEVDNVVASGYAPDLTDIEIEKLGRDPFLIAYGLRDRLGRGIVTTETSSPSKQRANKKIPDVCSEYGIACITTFDLIRDLDFRTSQAT